MFLKKSWMAQKMMMGPEVMLLTTPHVTKSNPVAQSIPQEKSNPVARSIPQ
jgi:hypothetical protein